MSFELDFLGRLSKVRSTIAASQNALYEAISNAFDATSSLVDQGSIIIRILRKPKQNLFGATEKVEYDLLGYEVEDNGIGFTDENLQHFKRSDTTNKPRGKGVGRLLWLHVFDRAEIDSTYTSGDDKRRRSFVFSKTNNGVNDAETTPRPAESSEENRTIVRLVAPKANRVQSLTQEAKPLANQILEHFLLYFTALRGRSVKVIDNATKDEVDLNDLFSEAIGQRHSEEGFTVNEYMFSIHHVFVKPTTTRRNSIYLCANRRVVEADSVSTWVLDIGNASAVTLDGLRYHAYVTGDYLDSITDDERTGQKFSAEPLREDDEDEREDGLYAAIEAEDGVSRKMLFKAVAERIRERLKDYVDDIRHKKEGQLENFARKEQPQFTPYIERAKQHLDRLKARPSKKSIEMALYEAKLDGRREMDELLNMIIIASEAHQQVSKGHEILVTQFVREANKANVSALAEYVCLRRSVLSVLKNLQKKDGDLNTDNEYESVIHELFFPMGRTSDSVPCGPHENDDKEIAHLWLVSEQLVFHKLLASDLPLSKLKGFLSGSEVASDIVIFDPAFSTTDDDNNLSRIAIVEFKRPGRDDYGPAERKNPVLQVIRYAQKMDTGAIEDRDGSSRPVPKNVRKYAYIIADTKPTLVNILDDFGFNMTPDQIGYYWYHPPTNMIVEVIPWRKLIDDAERRNMVFFGKLHLPY